MGARILCAVLLATTMARAAAAEELVAIVHADRDAKLSVSEIAQIYLKRRRFWQDGGAILPVNRDAGSPARESFESRVLGEDARQLAVYWNRQYFRGVLPPATLASDEAVKRFVASEPRAIGYISRRLVDGSVKVVVSLGNPPD